MGSRSYYIDPYNKNKTEKSQALNIARAIAKETRRVTRQEKLFPKRARWQGCYTLMDCALKLHMAVAYANGIRVETHALMVERFNAQTMAISWTYTMGAVISSMQDDLEADADKLEPLAGLINNAHAVLTAWKTADLKRFEQQFGSLRAEELGEPGVLRLRWF